MSKSALEPLNCPQCGGNVELDDEQEYGFCKYCGTKVQNSNFKIIKGNVKVENAEKLGYEMEKGRIAAQKEEQDRIEKEKIEAERQRLEKIKREKITYALIFFIPLSILIIMIALPFIFS